MPPLFREIGRRYGPVDVGLVGIGAYEPPIIMKPVHTTPEEAVEILKDVRAKTGIGMHWGTVVLAEEPQFEAADRFRAAGRAAGFPEQAILTLRIGESRSF